MEEAEDPHGAGPPSLMTFTLHHRGQTHRLDLAEDATLQDLSSMIEEMLSIPPEYQKLLCTPKPGLLKPPFPDPSVPLKELSPPNTRKIILMGSTSAEVSALAERPQRTAAARPVTTTKLAPRRDWRKVQDEATYTFDTLKPLAYLPRPERSLRFLERLRDDPGIKASMVKHRWTVPVLTEMDPAAHTTHEGRTLGLNRNGGEIIELRLRTDAFDGYRDYKTIRKTLCHELAHNVHGEHDRHFWDLCKQIEQEVEQGDWKSGGKAVGQEEFYNPDDGGVGDVDGGGWTGGEFVLGSGANNQNQPSTDRRSLLAKAAERRSQAKRNQQKGAGAE